MLRRTATGPARSCRAGVDRFQYTDKFGEGNYHCRQVRPRWRLQAAAGLRGHGLPFAALRAVEQVLWACHCLGGRLRQPVPQRHRESACAGWCSASGTRRGRWWPAMRSGPLPAKRHAGLTLHRHPPVLRCHPSLGYFEKGADGKSRQIAAYPAMLALIQAPDGQAVTLHRTYLRDGRKLDAADAKKVLSAGIHGAAVRLFDAGAQLALCEGIETALAVHLATGKPVWAGISAGNLEKLWVPDTVREVCIYADNDAGGDFAGQCFAYALARRLRREPLPEGPRSVDVFLPRLPGTDWADVWRQRQQAATGPSTRRVA
jgi:putative DNA primase/helicase